MPNKVPPVLTTLPFTASVPVSVNVPLVKFKDPVTVWVPLRVVEFEIVKLLIVPLAPVIVCELPPVSNTEPLPVMLLPGFTKPP